METLISLEGGGVHQYTINPEPKLIAISRWGKMNVRNTFPQRIREDGADQIGDTGRFLFAACTSWKSLFKSLVISGWLTRCVFM